MSRCSETLPSLTVVGAGAAFDPELANTSLLYRDGAGFAMLLDCGYAVPHALWRLSQDASLLDAVFVTHIHADHTFGLPALLAWMKSRCRERPLTVAGGPGIERWLWKLLDLGYPGSYAPEKCFRIDAVEVSPGEAWAPVERLSVRVAESDHKVRNSSVRVDSPEGSVAYSGDGDITEGTAALFANVGVLVHESFTDLEPRGGHAAAKGVVAMAEAAAVGCLALVHVATEEQEAVRARVRAYDGPLDLVMPAAGDVLRPRRGPGGRP